jgi:Flp pilus assembly protein TadG
MNRRGDGDRGDARKSGERGASAVEAAIVTPLVMALLFGIIELGFLFKDYLAVAGAVRSGVRIASAMPRNATFAQAAADKVALHGGAMNFKDVQELWVYKAGTATDTPAGFTSFTDCTVCVKFSWDAGTQKFVTTNINGWKAIDQNACSSSTERDRIGVYVELKHDAFTGLVFDTVTISEASIMSLETISFLNVCKPL